MTCVYTQRAEAVFAHVVSCMLALSTVCAGAKSCTCTIRQFLPVPLYEHVSVLSGDAPLDSLRQLPSCHCAKMERGYCF